MVRKAAAEQEQKGAMLPAAPCIAWAAALRRCRAVISSAVGVTTGVPDEPS